MDGPAVGLPALIAPRSVASGPLRWSREPSCGRGLGGGTGAAGEVSRGDVARTLTGVFGALALGLGPGLYAWTTIHQTGLVEAAKVVVGAAAPILVLMWRDLGAARLRR